MSQASTCISSTSPILSTYNLHSKHLVTMKIIISDYAPLKDAGDLNELGAGFGVANPCEGVSSWDALRVATLLLSDSDD